MSEEKKSCGCKWERRTKGGCPELVSGLKCDFKDLPYEKDAIIDRMQQESAVVRDKKDQLIKGMTDDVENEARETMDRVIGMQIMADALSEDFGMSFADIKKVVGEDKMSFMQKMRLAAAVKKLQDKRRGA